MFFEQKYLLFEKKYSDRFGGYTHPPFTEKNRQTVFEGFPIKLTNILGMFPRPPHLGLEHASREKKLSMVNYLIFGQKNVSTIRFQKIKIRPLKGFKKMRFLCFYIIGV